MYVDARRWGVRVILCDLTSLTRCLSPVFWQVYWMCLGTPAPLVQRRERWGVGGREVFYFWCIVIKVGTFNHKLISITEERRGGKWRVKSLRTQTTRGIWKSTSLTSSFFSLRFPLRFFFPRLFHIVTEYFCLGSFLFPWLPTSLHFSALGAQCNVILVCG